MRAPESRGSTPESAQFLRDRTCRRVSEVDELIAVEVREGTLLTARAPGEIVAKAESHEPCLEIAEVEMGGRGQR